MKHLLFITSLLTLFTFSAFAGASETLEEKLFLLPDVKFKELPAYGQFEKVYELYVKQPIDHKDVSKGYFYQRVILSHMSYDSPMVMLTEGYKIWRTQTTTELATLLKANQIDVEHRYFANSCPDTMDYTYLTTEQESDDLHHINKLLRTIYDGKWISTGRSKCGATSIFYRYFYPEDVDVSVPYVAPINKEQFDARIYDFLDTIGSDECRDKLYAIQTYLLKHRAETLPLLKMYVQGADLEFNHLTLEEAFEYTVLEYPFTFWQYGSKCEEIPDTTVSVQEVLSYMLGVCDISFFGDNEIDAFLSHYYQSATEMGYYAYKTDRFKGLLKALPMKPYPSAALVPDSIPHKFDGALLKKINHWLANDANRMIYIYGKNDTWTASAVPESKKVDAVWFFMENCSHSNAEIGSMNDEEHQLLVETLERWLDMEIE